MWNRSNRHWFPVDVIRKKMRCAPNMEPVRSNVENQMIYVVAFEEGTSPSIPLFHRRMTDEDVQMDQRGILRRGMPRRTTR